MGHCCSWKSDIEGAGEMKMRAEPYNFDNIPRLLNHERSSNMFKISPFLTNKESIPDYFLKQEIFYKNINDVILNSNNNKIDTINIESLWNISKYYKQDFTNCPYILYDLRKKEFKVENFLKKYKCINYNISEIKTFNGNRLKLFKNFIRNKNIIKFLLPCYFGYNLVLVLICHFLCYYHFLLHRHHQNLILLSQDLLVFQNFHPNPILF